ncbi:MAG: porin [Saprospiraceae bacterium]|nr:porin [Saprospiraceae bacterium]
MIKGSNTLSSQAPAVVDELSNNLTISAYLETYYSYDVANPANHIRQPFVYSHNRHNEFNLNLGFLKMAYANDQVRANFAMMAGTYSNDNLSAEQGVMKNIFEANAGFKISGDKNIWIDAGIFASHIGFESAIGKDCWNVTRSILADNSPYYEAGAKITYASDNGKWTMSGLILNGWQRIYRRDGNHSPGFGHQLIYKPSSKITLNSSSFIGNDMPDSARQMRYFHNFYGQFQLNDKLGMIVGFDLGFQQESHGSSSYNKWYSPVLIMKFSPSDKLSLAARAEYYKDSNGVIISTGTPNNFATFGYSVNLDYLIHSNVLWRLEARGFSSKDKIFIRNGNQENSNYFLTTALAISF